MPQVRALSSFQEAQRRTIVTFLAFATPGRDLPRLPLLLFCFAAYDRANSFPWCSSEGGRHQRQLEGVDVRPGFSHPTG
jgi:hypothetical protein